MRKTVSATVTRCTVVIVSFGLFPLQAGTALGHCDTLDGPVVAEARVALEKGDVTSVLKWVRKEDEAAIRTAFRKALTVRAKGPEARDLADTWFFETLVRIHRAGEGAPFTGLKPAGTVEPPVDAADEAIETGSVDRLAKRIADAAEKAVRKRFQRVIETKKHVDDSVPAGRAYVAAYVQFVHFVEGLHNAIAAAGAHHEAHGGQDEGHAH